MQKLTLGFSPCPNDTFIFDALIHRKIDTENLLFDVTFSDVEELNRKAFNTELDITKLSYHAYAYVINDYLLLTSGSALGNNCGPLLIKTDNQILDIDTCKIAIPGKYTTANLLLSIAYPKAKNKVETLFSEIEKSVINKEVDAGLIIHENRFTYLDKGLKKIIDLGEFWEQTYHCPIPLGGIVIKRDFPVELQQKINRVLKRSIQFAFDNPTESISFSKKHAQEMDEKVMRNHIDLYVNKYSLELGDTGKDAIEILYKKAKELKIIPNNKLLIFIE